ncbi:TPA: hypothetical protein DCQ82_02990 [Candidatus Veblenbacteria bacterium]|nr:hypothetical protein [Candidatus Veblenbacteria bacterium]
MWSNNLTISFFSVKTRERKQKQSINKIRSTKMRTLTICLAIFLVWLLPAKAQSTNIGQDIIMVALPTEIINQLKQAKSGTEVKEILTLYRQMNSELSYNNCAEDWPDVWRRHELCSEYEVYAWQDSLIIDFRSLLQNWNAFPLNLTGTLKFVVPPPEELVFNLIITNINGDTVYNRMLHYQLIGENWEFNIGFLVYVYTQENILITNPVPGLYTVKSIIMANQFTGHTVTLNFSVDNPVPVESVSFTAQVQQNDVRLSWTTVSELNNAGFYLERRAQHGNYKVISGLIPGQGTTTILHYYSYTDNNVPAGLYEYRLNQLDLNGSSNYLEPITVEVSLIPSELVLLQNYPNPFNPATTIGYYLPERTIVKLTVYDLLGQTVKILLDQEISAGNHTITFDASNLTGGTYFYQLQAGDYLETKKMSLLK